MSLDTIITRARRAAELGFRAECTITAAAGGRVFNPDTGEYGQATSTVYTGPCNVHYVTGGPVQTGGAEETVLHHVAVLPTDTPVETGHTLTVTAAAYDPTLIGKTFTVDEVGWTSWQTKRLATLEEVA